MYIDMKTMQEALEKRGYSVLAENETNVELQIISATHHFSDRCGGEHKLVVTAGSNGCAHVIKPNGTKKMYYEKSLAQLLRALSQIEEFYR